jgi:hypothetical protein
MIDTVRSISISFLEFMFSDEVKMMKISNIFFKQQFLLHLN